MRRIPLLLALMVCVSMALAQQAPSFTWDQLKAVYDVQPMNMDSVKSTDRTAAEGTYTDFNFPSENGSTAYGTFVRPNGKGPFPLIVLIHGLGSNRQQMIDEFSKDLLKAGFAVMALDAPHHGQRATPDDMKLFNSAVMGFAMSKDQAAGLATFLFNHDPDRKFAKFTGDAIEQGVRDYRRALAWVKMPEHRVDSNRIGVLGISLGSIMGSILSGVDPEINADLLVIGGDPIYPFIAALPSDQQLLMGGASSASLYLGHSTAHVMMLNGYNDEVIPRADTLRLYESAPGATLAFFDTPGDMQHQLGHSISREGYAIGEEWLEKIIAVPRPAAREHTKPAGAG